LRREDSVTVNQSKSAGEEKEEEFKKRKRKTLANYLEGLKGILTRK